MLSTKFKVSFVKLSLEIRYGLKDIVHIVVTSNLIIISYEKSSMCSKIKTRKKNAVPFLEMCFFTLVILSYLD